MCSCPTVISTAWTIRLRTASCCTRRTGNETFPIFPPVAAMEDTSIHLGEHYGAAGPHRMDGPGQSDVYHFPEPGRRGADQFRCVRISMAFAGRAVILDQFDLE